MQSVPKQARLRGNAGPVLVLAILALVALVCWVAVALIRGVAEPADAALETAARPTSTSAARPDFAEVAAPRKRDGVDAPAGVEPTGQRSALRAGTESSSTHWVEGQVLLPEGTPSDERVLLKARVGGRPLRGVRPVEADAQGHFRMTFPPDVKMAWLQIHGRYVWHLRQKSVRAGNAAGRAVQIEAALGGRIEGTVAIEGEGRLPAGKLVLHLGGSADAVEHRTRREQLQATVERSPDGRSASFSYDAVPAGSYRITCAPEGYQPKGPKSFRVLAAEVVAVDIDLVAAPDLGGQVVDETGAPIAGATVSAQAGVFTTMGQLPRSNLGSPGDSRSAQTDGNGRFVLRGVPPGRLQLHARANGYLSGGEMFDGPDGVGASDLTLTLIRGGVIEGHVLLANGEPAAEVHVQAEVQRVSGIHRSRSTWERTETDKEGHFILGALSGGTPYELFAGLALPASDPKYESARLSDVRPGSRDVVLQLGRGCTLTGHAVDQAGAPIQKFSVSVEPREGLHGKRKISVRSKEGAFRIEGLLPGEWLITLSASGYFQDEPTDISLPSSSADLVIQLARTSGLRGVVRGENGDPIRGAKVTCARDATDSTPAYRRVRWTNRRGEFRFRSIHSGTIRLNASADGYVAGEQQTLRLKPGEAREGFDLWLASGARIQGYAFRSDGSPATDARIRWHLNRARADSHGVYVNNAILVDAAGHFQASGLPDGDYLLVADLPISGPDGEVLGRATQSQRRALVAGDIWDVRFDVPHPTVASTTFRLTLSGKPWNFAVLELKSLGEGNGWTVTGRTGPDGIALLHLPGPGLYTYSVRRLDKVLTGTCHVGGSDSIDLDFSVGSVEGHATDQAGGSVAGASVSLELLASSKGTEVGTLRSTTADSGGNFQFDDVPAGDYRIQATSHGLENGGSSPWTEITISEDETTGPVELTLNN